jgi:hypothetical protein
MAALDMVPGPNPLIEVPAYLRHPAALVHHCDRRCHAQHGRLHRSIASLLLATVTLAACTSWQVQSVSPEQVVATQHPAAVRVQRVDSSSVVLDSPHIVSDTLVGAKGGQRTGVPLAHIAYVSVQHGNAIAKSVGLVLGLALVTFGILVLINR